MNTPPKNDLTTAVRGCARCGGDHDKVLFRRLSRGPIKTETGQRTHWAECPVNGEPILLSVEQVTA